MSKLFLTIILFVNLLVVINGLNVCGDWAQYKDIKCFKVLEKIGTEEEAKNNCSQVEKSSTLISIHSKEEQEFLNNLLLKYYNISVEVWIGMKYNDSQYQWTDGTNTNFTNWAEDAVKDGDAPCVQMSLVDRSLGKWTDMLCKKRALFICQKNQELNFNTFRDVLENMTKVFQKQQNSIESQQNFIQTQQNAIEKQQGQINSLIPIGFLYTQLPNQSSPDQLWPNMNWTEVTQQYAGLFFRAEGPESAKFGTIQPSNQSWISNINVHSFWKTEWNGAESYRDKYSKANSGKWIEASPGYAVEAISFFTTSGENRPKNTAIKLWKRIQ